MGTSLGESYCLPKVGTSLGESYSLPIIRGGNKSGWFLFFTNCKRWAQVWVSLIIYQLSEVGTSLGESYSLPIIRCSHKSGWVSFFTNYQRWALIPVGRCSLQLSVSFKCLFLHATTDNKFFSTLAGLEEGPYTPLQFLKVFFSIYHLAMLGAGEKRSFKRPMWFQNCFSFAA